MAIVTVSVGDENHEPTQRGVEEVKNVVSETVSDEHSILVHPYYVNIQKLAEEELGLSEEKAEKMEEKLSKVKAETQIRVQ